MTRTAKDLIGRLLTSLVGALLGELRRRDARRKARVAAESKNSSSAEEHNPPG